MVGVPVRQKDLRHLLRLVAEGGEGLHIAADVFSVLSASCAPAPMWILSPELTRLYPDSAIAFWLCAGRKHKKLLDSISAPAIRIPDEL